MQNQNDIFKRMRLSLPTNFEDALLEVAQHRGIDELMGTASEPLGHASFSSGPRNLLSQAEQAKHIRKAADLGIAFNFVLDAPCIGNQDYDLLVKEQILEQLRWASDQGISSVTVASAFFIELVKHHLPHLEVIVSQSAFVDSVEKTRQFESLGADVVTLHPDANRSFPLLHSLGKENQYRIRLIVNHGCAFQCVHGQFHALEAGHHTSAKAGAHASISCEHPFEKSAESFVQMRWIRPEDVSAYLDMGFADFVILGQGRTTEWIEKAANVWRSGAFSGDMLPLLDGGVRMPQHAVNGYQLMPGKLTNVLPIFADVNCRTGCRKCTRCSELASTAVTALGEAQ